MDMNESAIAGRKRGLNEFHPRAAYHCGRLLSVCQQIQDLVAREVGATYTSQFFTAASNSPAYVLPLVQERAMKRLKQVRPKKRRPDLQALLTRIYDQIHDAIPARLNMQGKADFQLGYFHQQAVTQKWRGKRRYLTNDGKSVKING